MPAKGYRKENPRNVVVQARITEEEKQLLEEAMRLDGYKKLGPWIRATLLTEAETVIEDHEA